MKTKRERDLPFKMQNKKVLGAKIEGPNVLVLGMPDEDYVGVKPEGLETGFDKRVASEISDKEFVLEGWINDGRFYASDILYYDDEDLRDMPWNERYKYLINKFDWNYSARLSRPIVISSNNSFDKEEELKEAAEIYRTLPNTEGMIVRDYDSKYNDDRKFIPDEELNY